MQIYPIANLAGKILLTKNAVGCLEFSQLFANMLMQWSLILLMVQPLKKLMPWCLVNLALHRFPKFQQLYLNAKIISARFHELLQTANRYQFDLPERSTYIFWPPDPSVSITTDRDCSRCIRISALASKDRVTGQAYAQCTTLDL